MRKMRLLFLTAVILFGLTPFEDVYGNTTDAPYGEYNLTGGTYSLSQSLSPNDAWTIEAVTTYNGVPVSAAWGSNLLKVILNNSNNDSNNELQFYMWPPLGTGSQSGSGVLVLNGKPLTDVLDIDKENGTEYRFKVISCGDGTIWAMAVINGITYSTQYTSFSKTITGFASETKFPVKVTISEDIENTIVTVAPLSLAAPLGESLTQTVTVSEIGTNSPSAGFSYTLDGDDADAFEVQGGTETAASQLLNITFSPKKLGVSTARLTIGKQTLDEHSAEAITVLLSGKADFALPFEFSASEAADDSDKWYYIFNPKRLINDNQVITDKDGTIKQTKVTAYDVTQLWKVIRIDKDKYQFINKGTEKKIDCTSGTITTKETSSHTFKLVQGTSNNLGFFVIYSNDAELSINKSNNDDDDGYTLYGNPEASDLGNCVQFFSEADGKNFFYPDAPLLSTDEDEYWYQIQFHRQQAKAIEVVEAGEVLKQSDVDADSHAQYWKFVGTNTDNFTVVSYSGLEIKDNGGDRYTVGTAGEGNSLKLEGEASTDYYHWQIYNNTTTVDGYRYWNDISGTALGGYSRNDAGAYLFFTPATPPIEFAVDSPDARSLGTVQVGGPGTTLTIPVVARNLSATGAEISYEITDDDNSVFSITPATGWSTKRGGGLELTFTPTAKTEYRATLTVKVNDELVKTISLSGAGADIPLAISTQNEEVWYYIENGHSANSKVTNNDGRFGGLISSNGEAKSVNIDLLRSYEQRGSQKWKLVSVPNEAGFYYLVNQNGEYFYRDSRAAIADVRKNFASVEATGDTAKYNILAVSNSNYYYTIRRKGRSNTESKLAALNGGNQWTFDESTGTFTVQTNGLTNSPRTWRFVPEAEIDAQYPDIAPKGTPVKSTAWYYVKNLSTILASGSGKVYLTNTGSGFELQERKTDADSISQLFGFIGNDTIARAATTGGHVTHIVSKLDTTKYLNQTTLGTAYNWYIEHVFSPADGAMQHTLRTNRHGDFLIAGVSSKIGTEAVSATNSGNSATLDTYNSVYNWGFEPVTSFNVFTDDLDFGEITIGETGSQAVEVAVGNSSDTIAYVIGGTDAAFFAIDWAASHWDKKRGGYLTVAFTPDESKENYSATLTLSVGEEDTKTLNLSGSGSSDPAIVLDPDEKDFAFGYVFTGMRSAAKTVAVSIRFADDNINYELLGEDEDKAAFTITEDPTWSDADGGTLHVVFSPTETREYSASIKISSGDVEETITLSGTGISNTYVFQPIEKDGSIQTIPFEQPLSATDAWTIRASIDYKGDPVTTWGSWLFKAGDQDIKLEFYMRPPVGYPNSGAPATANRLLLANTLFTGVLDIDMENGTPFLFEIISDGSGAIVATATVNGITYTKIYPAGEIVSIPSISAGARYPTEVTITQGAKAIVAVAPATISSIFPEVLTHTMAVYGIGTGTLDHALAGDDVNAFSITSIGSSSITLQFSPTEARTYRATLTVSDTDATDPAEPVTVLLEGKVDFELPFELSVSETADSDTDKWYYLFNPRRVVTGQVIAEGESNAIEQSKVGETSDAKQLWKIIKKDVDRYQFINKDTGNKLHATSGSDAITTASTTTATFKIFAGTSDNAGNWVIYSNDRSKSINKAGSGTAYSLYGNPAADDSGNCVRFVKEEDGGDTFYPDKPLLSTEDEEHWYQIQFFRRLTKAIENVPGQSVLQQTAIAPTTTQYWKITGTSHDDCRIESYSGQEIKGNGSTRYTVGAKGEGHSFKFENNPEGLNANWQLYNNTTTVNNARYMNDQSGTEVTGYSKNDAGAFLLFLPVSPDPEFSAPDSFDAGDGYVDSVNVRLLPVAGRNLSGTISYSISDDTDNAFAVAAPTSGWSDKRGGNLAISFRPTEVYKVYSAKLILSTDGQADLEVALTGTGYSDPIIVPDPTDVTFGDVTVGLTSEAKAIEVTVLYPQSNVIHYEIKGDDKDAFTLTTSDTWTETDGGTLNVALLPTETRTYSAVVEISYEKAETQTITLSGQGVITELPVSLSTDDQEIWYYIEANKRTEQYLYDRGANRALEIGPALPDEDGQLWKVVSTGISGKYLLISKAGNQLAYTYDAIATGDIPADRIYTTPATANTYNFVKRSDGHWQIRCNEEDLYLYKLDPGAQLSNTQFSLYLALPHDGSSVAFIPEAEVENRLPTFSTEEQTAWYYLSFQQEQSSNRVIQGNETNQAATQVEKIHDRRQFWKFTGKWDNFKIIDIDNRELKLIGTSYGLAPSGTGHTYRLFWHAANGETGWRIVNRALTGEINQLITSHPATDPAEIRTGKEDGNPGHALDIVPIELFEFTIEAGAEISANTYDPALYGDIIIRSTATATGQLKDIPAEGLTVNGVLKLEKTFTAGTHTLGFPFALATVSPQAYTLQTYNGATNLFEPATEIEAGKGYLIAIQPPMINEEEANDEPAGTTLTFTSVERPTLHGNTLPTAAEGYHLIANPFLVNLTQPIDRAEATYTYDPATQAFTLLPAATPFTLKPFEALITVKGATGPLYEHIGDGLTNALEAIDGSDPVVATRYYTLQGHELPRLSTPGVYIVKRIHASQRVEIIKVLHKK